MKNIGLLSFLFASAVILSAGAAISSDKVEKSGKSEKSAASVPAVVVRAKHPEDAGYSNGRNGYDEYSKVDHIEGLNRTVLKFNEAVDDFVMKPVSRGYRAVVPEYGRKRVRSFFTNISSPVVFVNDVLQGDVDASFTTFWRFVLNTTFGIGGLYDFAGDAGLKHRPEDFGQTFAVYGAGDGTYIMLPILGPSTARDAVGRVFDYLVDPFSYANGYITYGTNGGELISKREELLDPIDDIYRDSFDPYSAIRSAYLQHRKALVKNGQSDFGKTLEKQ